MDENPDHLVTSKQLSSLVLELSGSTEPKEIYRKIVNAPFTDKLLTTSIDLGIVVLLLVNKVQKTLDRVALSETDLARGAVRISAKPFHEIRIPLNAKNNLISEAVKTNQYKMTNDWYHLFTPVLTADEAKRNQRGASIESSLVWPLSANDGGALIFSFYQPIEHIKTGHLIFAKWYATQVNALLKELPPAA